MVTLGKKSHILMRTHKNEKVQAADDTKLTLSFFSDTRQTSAPKRIIETQVKQADIFWC